MVPNFKKHPVFPKSTYFTNKSLRSSSYGVCMVASPNRAVLPPPKISILNSFLNKDFDMKMKRKEKEHVQQLDRVKFQNSMEKQQVISRANHITSELGKPKKLHWISTKLCDLEKKIKDLERQLRKKDVLHQFQNLEDETYMRDVIRAETHSSQNDAQQHFRGRSVSDRKDQEDNT